MKLWPFSREEKRNLENPQVSISDADIWGDTVGVNVSRETALSVPAVWAAVNFLSSTIASLPLMLYERNGDERQRSTRPLQRLLHDAPNREFTSYRWRKFIMQEVLLEGRGMSLIRRGSGRRNVLSVWPLRTRYVTPERRNGSVVYHYRPPDGEAQTFDARDIIDLQWSPASDPMKAVNPLDRLRGAIGLAIALEQHAEQYFKNGGAPPLALHGPISSPGAARRASRDIISALLRATRNSNVIVLPTGHELKEIGFDPQKSQLEQARRFQLEEVARVYDLPPVFLQDLTHGTFSNTEQQDLHFVKHTLRAWLTNWEQELNLKLFGQLANNTYVEFNVDGLLRGDFVSRMAGMSQAVQNAMITPNEARRLENREPLPGGDGLMLQQNMMPLSQLDLLGDQGQEPGTDQQPPEEQNPE